MHRILLLMLVVALAVAGCNRNGTTGTNDAPSASSPTAHGTNEPAPANESGE